MKKVNPNTKKLSKIDSISKDKTKTAIYASTIESIIKEMNIETGESFDTLRRLVGSVFKFTNRVLKDSDVINNPIIIQWIHVGQFNISKRKVENYKRRLEKRRLFELNKLEDEGNK